MNKDINIESPIVSIINNISRRILLLGAFTHTIYLVIFIAMGIKELVIFNIFSIICYTILQSKPFNKNISIIFFIIHVEVTAHAAFAIILLGWDYGFSYIIICLITLMYISPFKNKKLPYVYGAIEMTIFLILRWYCLFHNPIYQNVISNDMCNLFLYYNLFTCFTIIVFLSRLNNSTNDLAQYILTETNKDLQQSAWYDPLTHLLNRRYMQIKLEEAIVQRDLNNKRFCIAIGDIDNFKLFNDTYGHFGGDFVLERLADTMVSSLKENDCVCRWGGEEFLLLLYCDSAKEAKLIIEELQNTIKNSNWIYNDKKLNITMTFGISCCSNNKTIEQAVEEADKLLYKGKKQGKNCVIIKKSVI